MHRISSRSTVLAFAVIAVLCAGPLAGRAAGAETVFPPASRVGLVPPPSFVVSTTFYGFRHNDRQASIVIAELPGYAFESIEKEVADQAEKNPGTVDRRSIELGEGARGFLLKGSETTPQGPLLKWTLVATANNVTALVTALIPEAVQDVAPEAAILATLSSVRIRASVPVEEQLGVLPFLMDDLAGFRILRVQPGTAAMLTDGPKDAIEGAEQPIFLVSLTPMPAVPPVAERDGFSRRLIGETPGVKEMRIVRSEPLRIANQQGHEVLIEAKDVKTGADINAVQWLRFGSGSLLRMFGVARKDDWDETYSRFRKVRDGVGQR